MHNVLPAAILMAETNSGSPCRCANKRSLSMSVFMFSCHCVSDCGWGCGFVLRHCVCHAAKGMCGKCLAYTMVRIVHHPDVSGSDGAESVTAWTPPLSLGLPFYCFTCKVPAVR